MNRRHRTVSSTHRSVPFRLVQSSSAPPQLARPAPSSAARHRPAPRSAAQSLLGRATTTGRCCAVERLGSTSDGGDGTRPAAPRRPTAHEPRTSRPRLRRRHRRRRRSRCGNRFTANYHTAEYVMAGRLRLRIKTGVWPTRALTTNSDREYDREGLNRG